MLARELARTASPYSARNSGLCPHPCQSSVLACGGGASHHWQQHSPAQRRQENYPAWLEAIRVAKQRIHFESYIIHEDDTGRMFAEALIGKAKEGVHVRLIYDWLGGCGTASRAFWSRMRAGGVVEDETFAQAVEAMFLANLENSTEIVLDAKRKVRAPNQPPRQRPVQARGGGSSGRAAAGAVRIANLVGAAFTNRRVIEPVEARITVGVGLMLVFLAVLFGFFPRVIAYPLVLLFIWFASALLYQGWKLRRARVKCPPRSDLGLPARRRPSPF